MKECAFIKQTLVYDLTKVMNSMHFKNNIHVIYIEFHIQVFDNNIDILYSTEISDQYNTPSPSFICYIILRLNT